MVKKYSVGSGREQVPVSGVISSHGSDYNMWLLKQLNLKNCDMVIWYANNLFTLQGLPNLTNPGHLQGLLNLTNPGHFNNDISLTSKSTSPSSYCVINRYTILWTGYSSMFGSIIGCVLRCPRINYVTNHCKMDYLKDLCKQ
jgi:hypothetical protein